MIIYPASARIPIKVGDVTFVVKPLTTSGRHRLTEYFTRKQGKEVKMDMEYHYQCLKLTLCDVKGLKNPDGSSYKLKVDNEGFVTDDCLDEVSQVLHSSQVAIAASSLIGGMVDPKIDGVEVDLSSLGLKQTKKKKTNP